MGAVSIGAYVPPDTIVGGVLATAFAISMGKGIETAVTLAMPIALVSQAIGNFCNVFNSVILRFTDRYAMEGKYGGVVATHWLIGMITIVRRFLLVFFAFYLGSEAVGSMINAIPAYVTDGMAAAAGLLPALGVCNADAHDGKQAECSLLFSGICACSLYECTCIRRGNSGCDSDCCQIRFYESEGSRSWRSRCGGE